jgi:hypothetical protein
LADLARDLGWFMSNGKPHKVQVQRMLRKLKSEKLVTQERGQWLPSEKGQKAVQAQTALVQ